MLLEEGVYEIYCLNVKYHGFVSKTLAKPHRMELQHHQMANTEIRLIIFFAAKDEEALYSQQKQDWELTMAQTMNSLLPNSDLN